MTTIEDDGARSAKCLSDGMLLAVVVDGEDFEVKRTVKAGAISFKGVVEEGVKGDGDI